MGVYQYDNYRSPYVGTLAELMQAGPRAQAQAALQVGQARAQGAQMQGAASAQMAQTIGNSLGQLAQIPLQLRQQEQVDQQNEFRGLQMQDARNTLAAQQTARRDTASVNEIMKHGLVDNGSGVFTFDRGKIETGLVQANLAHQLPAITKVLDEIDAHTSQVNSAKRDALGALAYGVHQNGDTFDALQLGVAYAIKNGLVTDAQVQPLLVQAVERPEAIPQLTKQLMSQSKFADKLPAEKAPGTREVKVRNADGSETIQIVADTPGFTTSSAAPAEKKYQVTVPGPNGQPITKLVTEDELSAGVRPYREPKDASAEPLVPIIGPDGRPLLVSRSQALGKMPASSREQGRPVTSGDAGKVADYDTSLHDLTTLRTVVKDPGTISRIQASLPTWVSEVMGGWTDDAKQQNAVIARVRQVIGKALEGGVLRKEDEEKYKTILPVIGDSKAVALAKIDGLEKAITQRRSTQLDALADAGYDVSRFTARTVTPPPPSAAPKIGDVVMVRGQRVRVTKINPNGTFEGVPVS